MRRGHPRMIRLCQRCWWPRGAFDICWYCIVGATWLRVTLAFITMAGWIAAGIYLFRIIAGGDPP